LLEWPIVNRLTLHDENNKCVLLEDISEAENLALVFVPITFTFNMEMKHCPTFRKLKSLLLNDFWCVPPDFHALTCMLKHSPVLQKLTLQLSEGPQHKLGIKGRHNPSEISAAISGNLKIVEVKCEVVDERVLNLEVLGYSWHSIQFRGRGNFRTGFGTMRILCLNQFSNVVHKGRTYNMVLHGLLRPLI